MTVLPAASVARTVTVPAAPAVVGEGKPDTTREVAAAGLTVMPVWEPVRVLVAVSVYRYDGVGLRYYQEDRHFNRHDVTPGLTGWWQITSRTVRPTEVDPKDDLETKARDDAYYVANRSLWLDLKILIRTGLVVVLGRGAF